MSDSMTPEKFLKSYVDQFNKGDMRSILTLYESDACFVSQPGQVVKGEESIRHSLQPFIDIKGRLESNVKGVFRSSDIALVITESSYQWNWT